MTPDREPPPKRKATRPIPEAMRTEIYMAVWDLAWSGHFYRTCPPGAAPFLRRFGSGSLVARRHGLTILWLTALAGRFNELASLRLSDIDGNVVNLQRSKRGARHAIVVDEDLIHCTAAWHNRLGQFAVDHPRRGVPAHRSVYLLPNHHGGQINCNVFNRDVAGPLGELWGLRLSSHCFRDTACQEAMRLVKHDASLDVRAVQALMGHRSARTTEIYLRKQQSSQLCIPLGG